MLFDLKENLKMTDAQTASFIETFLNTEIEKKASLQWIKNSNIVINNKSKKSLLSFLIFRD